MSNIVYMILGASYLLMLVGGLSFIKGVGNSDHDDFDDNEPYA